MSLDERVISEAILTRYFDKFKSSLDLDAAIIGGGPSGMVAAWKLAQQGFNVALFERKLSLGGGMWGGGMTFNIIVVQDEARHILEELGVPTQPFGQGYHTADAVTATVTLAAKACQAGTKVFNCFTVEDVVLREHEGVKRLTGLVVNSTPVEMGGLHVDPLVLHCACAIEATGHDVDVLKTLMRKNDVRLSTPSGKIEGEQSMWAEVAEENTPKNTREVFPGLWVAGMAANATFGSYRMGPVFGGMLLSGVEVARQVAQRLKQGK